MVSTTPFSPPPQGPPLPGPLTLPLALTGQRRLGLEQFAQLCAANPEAVLELASDGSVRSPDASLVALQRWRALSDDERQGFAPLCPDLVVELASASDDGPRGLAALRNKMADYQGNGARLGWLLIPAERAVEVWSTRDGDNQPQRFEGATRLEGGKAFPGLAIELAEIWAG